MPTACADLPRISLTHFADRGVPVTTLGGRPRVFLDTALFAAIEPTMTDIEVRDYEQGADECRLPERPIAVGMNGEIIRLADEVFWGRLRYAVAAIVRDDRDYWTDDYLLLRPLCARGIGLLPFGASCARVDPDSCMRAGTPVRHI